MSILVVNDDGISSAGIKKLATYAREFGEVTVVAPRSQCSAMSRRITVHGDIACEDRTKEFGVEGIRHAYAIDGTPADCVKLGVYFLCPEGVDIVFSGINYGYNTGVDLCYSGTMGAALEALERGIPAIAFSADAGEEFGCVDEYLVSVTKEILTRGTSTTAVWNVNFPGLAKGACKGVLWDRVPDKGCFFVDKYEERTEGGERIFTAGMYPAAEGMTGSDIEAVKKGFVSVGMYHSSW